jgi:hypothetical protein
MAQPNLTGLNRWSFEPGKTLKTIGTLHHRNFASRRFVPLPSFLCSISSERIAALVLTALLLDRFKFF